MFLFGPVVSLAGALVILELVLEPGGLMAKIVSLRWLVLVGKISYGLYLWHLPIFLLVRAEAWQLAKELTVEMGLTLSLTLVSFWVIERPLLRWKQRFRGSPTRHPVLGVRPGLPLAASSQQNHGGTES